MPAAETILNKVNNEIQQLLNGTLSTEESYDFAPVLHRVVPKHSNIKMSCTFNTSDPSTSGNFSYITFWRSPNGVAAHDGVGIAYKKGDGNLYNFYIVDNDFLSDGIYITEKIVREDTGINNFIAGGKFEILTNTTYNISLKILEDYSIIAKIWNDGTSEPADGASPGADYLIINSGAKLTAYRTAAEEEHHFGISVPNTQ